MKTILPQTAAAIACTLQQLGAYTTYSHTEPIQPLEGEVQVASFFSTKDNETRLRILQDLSPYTAAYLDKFKAYLANPDDDELFYQLTQNTVENSYIESYALSFCKKDELPKALPLLRYRHLLKDRIPNATYEQAPSRKFVLRMRDLFRDYTDGDEIYKGIIFMLQEADDFSMDELYLLNTTLKHFCNGQGRSKIFALAMKLQLQNFKGGKRVEISDKEAGKIAHFDESYLRFLHAEKALRGKVCNRQSTQQHPHCNLLFSMIWRDSDSAVTLARTIDNPGFELLRRKPEALHDYLCFKGVTLQGRTGYDVPDCCLSALNPYAFGTTSKAMETVMKQADELPLHMQALAPRCVLAIGGGCSAWMPVTITPYGVCPFWPDASAVELPQWQPKLMGLPDSEPQTVLAAYDKDFKELEKLLRQTREEGFAGQLLATELDKCQLARPNQDALTIPIFARIALHFEEDGITVDFADDTASIQYEQGETNNPIVNEALCKVPQYMHRLTLQLAMLEKQGHTEELQQACKRLARLLNKHNLWPLIICQRELRGFSMRALLTLFEHYEGEEEPLFDYGEALGLRYEMRIARLGHEDDLGRNLLRAAYISRALAATDEEREEAIAAFMQLAREHAGDISPQLTGTILLHLSRWGITAPILQWQECPSRYLCGEFAPVGLQLIRALVKDNQKDTAAQILAKMAEHADTDTTPAYREAMALLESDPTEAQRLRHDALLLAMWRLRINYEEYCAYREDQAAHGTQYENMMKSDLIHSWGRTAGITPELALRFAREGMWEDAVFAYEYLLTDGISNATPYGLIPDHAHICYYRAFADICRSKMTGNQALVKRALMSVRGTRAEATAHMLIDIDKKSPAKAESQRKPAPVVEKIVADDSFRTWKWKDTPNDDSSYYITIHGKLLKGFKETNKNYPEDYVVSVLTTDGTIRFIRTFGMPAEQRKEVLEFCNNPANQTTKPQHASFAW
ncbi:MAG: hypothetical protein IKZ10_01145 [Akkermansia sp.]|nr:hypothetical protein [Akkermansia sp.]